jgi:hypothetical protein
MSAYWRRLRWSGIKSEFSVHFGVQAMHLTKARERDEFHIAGIAGLKTHGCSSRDIQAKSPGCSPVERQRFVDLEKVKMTPDLNRSVAGIRDTNNNRRETGIRGKSFRLRRDDDFSGFHRFQRIGW